ncbi:MAG: O-antigen ligase family protein [Acidobacteria bacterium]|nr:O-antigen ligase family protein [Acidobacteriota bacterium]
MNTLLRSVRLESDGRAPQTATLSPGQPQLRGAFFWLSAFYLVYCARPEEWIPGLAYLPLAKISGIFALLSLLFSLGKTKRGLRDLPREATYLLILIVLLVPSALVSPVWKGGALQHALDFSKVFIAWILTFLLVTDFAKLRRIIFIQAGSVAVISAISLWKGHAGHLRLAGALGGIYSNPNDLAFAIVMSLPICLAFMLSTRSALRKAVWSVAMLLMLTTVFLTGSRGGFVMLVIAGMFGLWHFGVRGRRLYLIAIAVVVGSLLLGFASTVTRNRFNAIATGDEEDTGSAYGSYAARRQLMIQAIEGIERYPILGIGIGNFVSYSGTWREVHMAYLQVGVEAGIPALILYLMFLGRGFGNLRKLRKMRDLDPEKKLFVAALDSSLIGFVTGALFAPVGFHYFPYFAVAYTSALLACVNQESPGPPAASPPPVYRFEAKRIFAHPGKANEPAPVR